MSFSCGTVHAGRYDEALERGMCMRMNGAEQAAGVSKCKEVDGHRALFSTLMQD